MGITILIVLLHIFLEAEKRLGIALIGLLPIELILLAIGFCDHLGDTSFTRLFVTGGFLLDRGLQEEGKSIPVKKRTWCTEYWYQ
jgi:hypothetical protein